MADSLVNGSYFNLQKEDIFRLTRHLSECKVYIWEKNQIIDTLNRLYIDVEIGSNA